MEKFSIYLDDTDSIRVAMDKINNNFKLLSGDLKDIIWNSIEATEQAMKDINDNFEKLNNVK